MATRIKQVLPEKLLTPQTVGDVILCYFQTICWCLCCYGKNRNSSFVTQTNKPVKPVDRFRHGPVEKAGRRLVAAAIISYGN